MNVAQCSKCRLDFDARDARECAHNGCQNQQCLNCTAEINVELESCDEHLVLALHKLQAHHKRLLAQRSGEIDVLLANKNRIHLENAKLWAENRRLKQAAMTGLGTVLGCSTEATA